MTSEDIKKDIDKFLANGGKIVKYAIIKRQDVSFSKDDSSRIFNVTDKEKIYGG